jgi:peptidoglycan/xylan/chitin deacetylase (PgdA/CDA1 family)
MATANGSTATKAPAKSKASASAKKPAAKAPAKPKAEPKVWTTSHRPNEALPLALAEPVAKLQEQLKMPVWLLLHNEEQSAIMDWNVLLAFLDARSELDKAKGPVALVIDSPGGYADVAYRIARTFCRHAGSFVAVVPRWAKSAATLLTLGAEELILAHDAEIGPLDVQVYDHEREQRGSALDEIQALDQLHRVALKQLNQNLVAMRYITRRRYDVVLPHASKLASDMMQPLLDKIDTVHYAKQSRLLAVAGEYAVRLMAPRIPKDQARDIADRLVKRYPEHGFVIDRREAKEMLNLRDHSDEIEITMRQIEQYLWRDNQVEAFGLFKEMA